MMLFGCGVSLVKDDGRSREFGIQVAVGDLGRLMQVHLLRCVEAGMSG